MQNQYLQREETADNYRLNVSGLVDHPATYSMSELKALPQTALIQDFQCVGNLASYSLTGLYKTEGAPPVPALNWRVALTPNGFVFTGTGLVNILAVEAGLFASVNGSVYHVNPADRSFCSVTTLAGAGSSDIQMASDGISLFCGVSDGQSPSKLVALTLNTDS